MLAVTPDDGAGARSAHGRWPWWISPLALLPLALAAYAAAPLWALPVGVAGAAAMLLEGLRHRSWVQRAAALEASALVVGGTAAAYATLAGNAPPLDVPMALACVLLLGTPLVGWAAETGHAPRGSGRSLLGLHWDRALALGLVITGVSLARSWWTFSGVGVVPYAWLVAAHSWLPLALLAVLCLPRDPLGRVTSALALVVVEVAAIWDFASAEVVRAENEPLTWWDLRVRFQDPASLQILADGLRSWRAVLVTLGIFGGFLGLARFLSRLRAGTSGLTLARLVGLVFFAGALLGRHGAVIAPLLTERYFVVSHAPWSPVHRPPQYELRLDLAVARGVRGAVGPPLWADGPAPLLPELAGRYAGHSVVLLVLESHRASDVAGLGEGALHHQPSSPRLSSLAAEGVLFTNYYQPDRPTHTAIWELLTGLPNIGGGLKPSFSGPEAASLGRMPDFRALGYQCDWICPLPRNFDNRKVMMEHAGARFWIQPAETDGFDRRYWTAWGMPDEQLFEVARRRFESVTSTGRPIFVGVLTIANHPPFSFPDEVDGQRFSHDGPGAMRYTDLEMGRLVDSLRSRPEADRPIIFVTADTSSTGGLMDAQPLGIANLEGLRIPGLLLLPDGALAGRRFEGVFSHSDLLDLLYLLVAPRVASSKFLVRHRALLSTTGLLVTDTTCFDLRRNRYFAIERRWTLRPTDSPPDRARILAARDYYEQVRRTMWRAPRGAGR